ncbi:MAG: TonB-dependent receptor [Bacteroidetes bacterium]|nr:MAG: TonB-dependent receptor [Bacteroidota bacterium]
MKLKILIFVLLLLQWTTIFAQSDANLFGHVVDETGEHIPFVNLVIKDTRIGTATDITGHYMITNIPPGDHTLVIQHVGHKTKEMQFTIAPRESKEFDITLETISVALEQVVISGSLKEQSLRDSPVRIEVLNAGFLQKTPSNNLMQSIGMINGVQQVTACGVCGTNEIRINGLEGSNTAVLIDGMPIMGALASVYGLNGIPNALIDRVEVIKGASSTLYGSEAIGGIINIITKTAESAPRFLFNTNWSHLGERSADIGFSPFRGRKFDALFSGSINTMERFMDLNEDNFADKVTIKPSVSLFNKWSFQRPAGKTASFAAKFYHENRAGGTREFLGAYNYKPNSKVRGSDSLYGETIFTNRYEVMGSYSLPGSADLRLDISQSGHWHDSWYGTTFYKGEQHISFANLIWQTTAGERHNITSGFTARYQIYDDNTPVTATGSDRQFIPGIFVQDDFRINSRTNLLAGARLDHHKRHGLVFSPRLSAKYDIAKNTIFRINSGTGFRTVNIFTEDHAALSGFREVEITEDLKPEQSWNISLSLNQTINRQVGRWIVMDADLFYTRFSNKILADYDTDPQKIIYRNLPDGDYAVSRGVAISANGRINGFFTWSAGFTWQDVFAVSQNEAEESTKEMQPLSPAFTGNWLLSWDAKKLKTTVDLTGTFTGEMMLPTFDPEVVNDDQLSKPYSLVNLLVNYNLNQSVRVYAGVNNILDWRQNRNPIINWQSPFSDDFDAANVYGPLYGRSLMMGIRLLM